MTKELTWMGMIRREVGKYSDKKIMQKLAVRGQLNREGRIAVREEAIKRGLIRRKYKAQSGRMGLTFGLPRGGLWGR